MIRYTFILSILSYTWYSFVVFIQVTQQVFVAEGWVWDACNEVKAKAHSCAEVERSLGALKQEQTELSNKLIAVDRARLSPKAGLKNVEMQAED